jgi:hypothetical protein
MMGWDMLSGVSFICATGDNVTIHFLIKKVSFCFNHPCNPDKESRSQKWKFKRF